jgi:drug/metabolite transporter (DMT)-like permease
MSKGIVLGMLYNVVVAIGFVLIGSVTTVKHDVFKACLMLCIAGSIALGMSIYFLLSGKVSMTSLDTQSLLYLALGSVLVLVVGDALYVTGLSASNATTLGYAALAYPAVTLIIEVFAKRISIHDLTLKDLLGFLFLAIGFLLISSSKLSAVHAP